MEPNSETNSGSNPFDIATILRQHEQQLRQGIARLAIRPHTCRAPPPSSPERQRSKQDTGRAQRQWERLRNKILAGQQEHGFSYRLRNLEEMREAVQCAEDGHSIVLPRRQSTFDDSSHEDGAFSEPTYTPDPVDSVEGPRSPLSPPEPPDSLASPATPASLTSPALPVSPDTFKFYRADSSADLGQSDAQRGLLRTRHSIDLSRSRSDSITFNGKAESARKKKKNKHRRQSKAPPSGLNSHQYNRRAFATALLSSGLTNSADMNPEGRGEDDAKVPAIEGMHASLDRLSKIFNEMSLLLNSTVHQQRKDEDSRILKSETSASATEHGMSSQTSSQPDETSMSSGEVLPPEAAGAMEAHASGTRGHSRRQSYRDFAPSSSAEYSPEIKKKGRKQLKPQRHRGGSSKRFVPTAMDAPGDSSVEDSDITLPGNVTDNVPSRPEVGTDSAPLLQRDGQSTQADNRRAYNALIAGTFPQLHARQPPSSLPGNDREANRCTSEAASLRQAACSPGEMPDNMFTEFIDYNPDPGPPEWRSEGELEPEFRPAARGVRWDDGGRFSNEVFCADIAASTLEETQVPQTWVPLQQSAGETAPSQHIWRYADSYSDRVYDEVAQRRAEVHRTTFGGNIGGQSPRTRASRVRLASYPAGRGRRMCEVKIVAIITPIKEDDATASSSSDAGGVAAGSTNPPQARPP